MKFIHTTIFILIFSNIIFSQQKLVGLVIDNSDKHAIQNAVATLNPANEKTTTDINGIFTFNNLSLDKYSIKINCIGYKDEFIDIVLSNISDTLIIKMQSEPIQLKDISVIGSWFPADLQNSPYPLNIEQKENISSASNISVPDALSKVPGLSLSSDGIWATTVSIRGLSKSNIVTLIDNTRIETATDIAGVLSLINKNDVEKTEVLKSSGSVLFGTGAVGGVINIVTNKGNFSDTPQIGVRYVSEARSVDNGFANYLSLNGSSDSYTAKLSAGIRNAGNTKTPHGVLPNSQYKDFTINGSLGFKTAQNHVLFLSYQRAQAEDTGIPGSSAFAPTAIVNYKIAKRELVSAEYNIKNISEVVTNLSLHLSRQFIDRTVENFPNNVLKIVPQGSHLTYIARLESKLTPISNDLLIVGTEVWQRELQSWRQRIFVKKDSIIGEKPLPSSKFLSIGLYAQNELEVIPSELKFILGIRYDYIKISNSKTLNPEYITYHGVTTYLPANQKVLWNSVKDDDNSWSLNGGLNYALSTETNLALVLATAFRSPSLEERFQYIDLGNSNIRLGNPYLKPERNIYLNFGVKHYGDKFNLNADVFVNELWDLITEIPGTYETKPALIKANIGKARLYGYEIISEFEILKSTKAVASVAYVRGEDILNNGNLPQISPINGKLALKTNISSVGLLNLSCTYFGSQNNIATGESRTGGYAIYDAGFDFNSIMINNIDCGIRIGVNNIFNRAYQNHLSTLRGIIKEEPGRNIFISVSVKI